MRIEAIFSLSLVLLLAASDDVSACSCVGGYIVYPPNGAVDVPTNALMVVAVDDLLPEVTLAEQQGGRAVPIRVEWIAGDERLTLSVQPEAPLAPGTGYVLSTYSERASFTTGDGPDEEPPTYEGLSGVDVGVAGNQGNTCYPSSDGSNGYLCLDYDAPLPDVAYLLLTLRTRAEPPSIVAALAPWTVGAEWPHVQDAQICGPGLPAMEPGTEYCVSLVAVDGAGHRAATQTEHCSLAVACADEWECAICRPASPQELPPEEEQVVLRAHGGGCRATPTKAPSGTTLIVLLLLMSRTGRRAPPLARSGA